MFLDHAEDMTRQNIPMHMRDWAESLNEFLKFRSRDILTNAGKITKDLADKKAFEQYGIYSSKRLKKEDADLIDEITELEKLE